MEPEFEITKRTINTRYFLIVHCKDCNILYKKERAYDQHINHNYTIEFSSSFILKNSKLEKFMNEDKVIDLNKLSSSQLLEIKSILNELNKAQSTKLKEVYFTLQSLQKIKEDTL